MKEHPELEELVGYARNALPRAQRRRILAHCEACPECNRQLAMILVLRTDHRRVLRQRARRQRLFLAATVVLIMGVASAFVLGAYFTGSTSNLAALATDETLPDAHVRFRFGAGVRAASGLSELELKQGMDALVAGDYSEAVDILEPLNRRLPSDTEVAAYLGMALYLSGDDSARTRSLLTRGQSYTRRPMVSRAATWYLANSLLRAGETEAARERLRTLTSSELSDHYSRRADELLHQIDLALGQ